MSMTTLTTRPGQGLNATVYADRSLEGYTVVVEIANENDFNPLELTKTPTVAGRVVTFTINSSEVDSIKDSRFRVVATKGAKTVTVDSGHINYIPAKPALVTSENIESSLPARLSDTALKAALGALVPRVDSFGLGVMPVVGYGAIPHTRTTNAAVGTGYTTRAAYKTVVACTDLRIQLPAWYVATGGNGTETANSSTITHKAAIEYAGVSYPLTFGGSRSRTIDPWAMITSDPLGLELDAGELFAVRTFFDTPASGTYISTTGATGSVLYGFNSGYGFTNGDAVDSVGAAGTVTSGVMPGPITVLGRPLGTAPHVVLGIGDSITYGQGDTGAPGANGWLLRGLNDTRPMLNLATPSIRASSWAAKVGHGRYGPFMSFGTHAVVMVGTNDIFTFSTDLATLQGHLTTICTRLAARGLKVIAATLTPQTTSTDAWVTTGNQTVKAQESVRVALNNWIRTTPAPLDGYFETADTVETARNSGTWKANMTADGVHPNQAAHTAMATAVDLAKL